MLLLVARLLLVLASVAPAAAQWFRRIGHVSKSRTIKAEYSNQSIKHHDKQKTKKRSPTMTRAAASKKPSARISTAAPEPEKTTL